VGAVIVKVFSEFLTNIKNEHHRTKTEEILFWVKNKFPNLVAEIKWNQPMFTNEGTFIIAFSVAKHHLAVAPEKVVIDRFSAQIIDAGYKHTQQLIQIPWGKEFDFNLLAEIISFNITDKADCTTFWRKN